jgi:fatty acid amide hydrolase 2
MHEAAETSFSTLMGNGRRLAAARELGRFAIGRSKHTFPGIMLALVEDVPKLMPDRTRRFLEEGRSLREEIARRVGNGVLLYPSYPTVAPKHVWPLLTPFHWVYTAIFNALEMPVTQVPLGLNAAGVPLGVQIVAGHGRDHVSIAVAMELERACGGWVPPS